MNGEEATEVEQAAFAAIKGDVGFVQSNLTSGTGPVNAPSAFSFNSSGATNVLRRTGTGTYRVDMPNLGATVGGHVQVTAFGNGNRRCKVAGWGSSGSTLQINVNCFNNGTPIDAFFMLNYIRRSDTPGADTAYLWAFDPMVLHASDDHAHVHRDLLRAPAEHGVDLRVPAQREGDRVRLWLRCVHAHERHDERR